ncbi:uncharacterized protein LOC129756313 [Uranotaenia lowii]|uniref:uncharacterized protein LOC129739828 n=1 Tax=Uranotaenia lowii TaxID=190385 RepID=UPI00247948A0|nr:uncharacterized protein LOC129739828 [Uranotaenia lowii]XP_055591457.1 uncharacterized protein LOC129743445 [Uranotaenia lowii]XP_055609133.1 uncharacterized protein LOC129756313 [Uranotaenia lowii]
MVFRNSFWLIFTLNLQEEKSGSASTSDELTGASFTMMEFHNSSERRRKLSDGWTLLSLFQSSHTRACSAKDGRESAPEIGSGKFYVSSKLVNSYFVVFSFFFFSFQVLGFKSVAEKTPMGFPEESANSYEFVPTLASTVQGRYTGPSLALYLLAKEDWRKFRL